MAERSPAEKDRLSHRGRAALRAGRYLRELAEKA
jgi:inosine/xanthosine triphosphate pyrophosphatase family protein